MTRPITDISATDWSPRLGEIGEVVEGLEDIQQCVRIILTTPKGSRPHEPEFGSDLWKYVDHPVNEAIPHLVREAIDALTLWEPRLELVGMTPAISEHRITIQVEWKLKDDETRRRTEVILHGAP